MENVTNMVSVFYYDGTIHARWFERVKHRLKGIDLSSIEPEKWNDIDLSELDLSYTGIRFNPQTILNKRLRQTNLEDVDLSYLDAKSFDGVDLRGANLKGTGIKFNPQMIYNNYLNGTNLEDVDLSYIPIESWINVNLAGANLKRTGIKFNPQLLTNKYLLGTNLEGVDLSHIKEEDWNGVCLVRANLKETNIKFNPQLIENKSLMLANLEDLDLSYIKEEDWADIDLSKANLRGAKVNLPRNIKISSYTILPEEYNKWKLDDNVDFSFADKWYERELTLADYFDHLEYFTGKDLAFSFSKDQVDILTKIKTDYLLKNENTLLKCEYSNILDRALIWYQVKEFIPNYELIKCIPIDKIKNFSMRKWHKLISCFDKSERGSNLITSMAKAAIVFGIFEDDVSISHSGYDKLMAFLKYVPPIIGSDIKLSYLYEDFLKYYHEDNIDGYMLNSGVTIPSEFSDFISTFLNGGMYQAIKNGHDHMLRTFVCNNYYPCSKHIYCLNNITNEDDAAKIKLLVTEYNINYDYCDYAFHVLDCNKMEAIFSDMKCEYNEDFYNMLVDNFALILGNLQYSGQLANIQIELKRIINKFGRNLDIIDCIRYLKEINYIGVNDGNCELAFLCKMCGIPQERFNKYQNIFESTKKRIESSIPYVEIPNIGGLVTTKMLRLDDPLQLVIGEAKLSNCCQKMGDMGESCMIHSATSKNGRVFVTYDEVGHLLTQSWAWRNGDVICFDNIEASDYFKTNRQKYEHLVIEAYEQASKELIRIDNTLIDEMLKNSSNEMIYNLNVQKLKMVTVGDIGGHNDIKLNNYFEEICNERRYPEEKIEYIDESNMQRVIAKNELALIDPLANYQNKALFRDPREIKKESGHAISLRTIDRIITIEKAGHLSNMLMHTDTTNVKDLANVYGCEVKNLNVILGEDWYYIYNTCDSKIYVGDLCRTIPRFKNEGSEAQKEMRYAFYHILNEAIVSNDHILEIDVDLREDTSYLLYLWLLKDGIIEQIGDDVRYEFDDRYNSSEYISKKEQNEYLKTIKDVRENNKVVHMHHLSFKPSEKYINQIHPKTDYSKIKK